MSEDQRHPPDSRRINPPPPGRTPAFNAPGVVVGLAAIILLTHLASNGVFGGGASARAIALWVGAVRTGATAYEVPAAPLFGLTPYVLHVFLHFGWLHLVLNLGALLAFGAVAARAFGRGLRANLGFLAFFFACAIGGAVLSVLVNWNSASLMVGASTAISGLVAAAGWARGGRAGMLSLAAPWLVINLGLGVAELFIDQPIAWAGHIGGLLVGMVAFPAFVALFGARRRV